MSIEELYELFLKHPQVTTDSRNCPKGSLFFALKGASFNGNEYAAKAIEKGCSYAIVDEEKQADKAKNILLVEDVLKTLQSLANYHRKKFRIPVIGITGTNGKTTTKELVTAVLKQEYNVLSTKGNLNNHIGVPLTLLELTKEHEIAVIEMGANHIGEIKTLAGIADPDYGLITNIGTAHLEGFGSFGNIIKTKAELYDQIRTHKDGKIFIDHDNPVLNEIADGMTKIEYGETEGLFVVGKVVSGTPYLSFVWQFSQNPHVVHTRLIGDYNLSNVLAAITVGKYFGVKSSLVCKALEEYTPTNNRSQLKETAKNHLIIDAYNANPTSMLAALTNFSNMQVDHKALILGDMRELGENSLTEHQKITDLVKDKHFDKVFLIGENFCQTDNPYSCFPNSEEFSDYLLKNNPLTDSYVLIKGSRGIQLEKCIDYL
ncbi:UDP-N-acetylmuramoyl-tripeptide--D-alanyl-D-alanine ligase [Viscerimonas tarda]